MKAEKIIRLRIQNSTFCRRIRVVQGDTGRIFRFILEDITMDGSEQARVYAKKPDGTEVYNDCEVVSPNEVLMESDSGQIFAAIGVVQAEIQISKLGKTITTYTFEFDVEISLTRAGAIQSSSEYGALEAAIAKAEGFYNPTFAEAKTRDNINSGESIPTLFGKVKKWFTDLNTLIKLVGSTDISGIGNGTVTDALSVLNSKQFSIINLSEEFTAKDGDYAYTGLSITIPEYTICLISISIAWMNVMPIGFILNSSDSECSDSTMALKFEGYPTVATYITESRNKSRTYYVWSKCGGIGVNRASIFGCSCKTK